MAGCCFDSFWTLKKPLDSLPCWIKMFACAVVVIPVISGLTACWFPGHYNVRFFSIWVVSESIGIPALGPVCLL